PRGGQDQGGIGLSGQRRRIELPLVVKWGGTSGNHRQRDGGPFLDGLFGGRNQDRRTEHRRVEHLHYVHVPARGCCRGAIWIVRPHAPRRRGCTTAVHRSCDRAREITKLNEQIAFCGIQKKLRLKWHEHVELLRPAGRPEEGTGERERAVKHLGVVHAKILRKRAA